MRRFKQKHSTISATTRATDGRWRSERLADVEQKMKPSKGKPAIEFEVDGEAYETRERDLTAGAVLGYAGKGFGTHYLVELLGRGGQQREYRHASDAVKVHPGSRFLTVSTGPTPVT